MIFTSLTFLYKYKCTLSIYLSPHSVSHLHPGVFQPPKLTKWEKRMKWEMDYSRADVRLWNQTSVQRWVNWISLPSVPSPGPPVSAEVPRSPGLFGKSNTCQPSWLRRLRCCLSFSPSRFYLFTCGNCGRPRSGRLARRNCFVQKIVNKILCFTAACLSTLLRPGICCSIHYTPLKQFVPLRHFKEMWLGVFPRPVRLRLRVSWYHRLDMVFSGLVGKCDGSVDEGTLMAMASVLALALGLLCILNTSNKVWGQ